MNVLTAYIVKEILKGSAIALIVLVTLFNLFAFSDELKSLGRGSYGIKEIIWYLLLVTPRLIYELMPYAALLGSLFVIGGMGNNRETMAMRASGLSLFWLIRTIMLAGLILVSLAIAIGEFIAPTTEKTAQVLKTTAQNERVVIHSQYGLWLRENNTFINAQQIFDNHKLGDIDIYQLDNNFRLQSIKHADTAQFVDDEKWQLTNIHWSAVSLQQVASGFTDKQLWQTTIDPDLLNIVVVKSDNLSLYDLYLYVKFLKNNNQKSQAYEQAFWGRVVNPLVTFVMLMVAAPFVLTIKQRVPTGGRLVIGILVGLAFNNFDRITGHLGLVYNFNPLLTAITPSLLVFSAALYVVHRLK